MILCLCHGITKEEVQKCIDTGETKVLQIVRKTGAGSCCGSCIDLILELIGDTDDYQETEDPLSETERSI